MPDPVYEDDDIRVLVVDPTQFMRRDSIGAIEPSVEEREFFDKPSHPALAQDYSITLTGHQWAGVLASLRALMAFSPNPGLLRLMHDTIYGQLPIKPRQDADGDPEGEK